MAKKYLNSEGLAYFWAQIKGMLSDITATTGNHETRIDNIETWENLHRIIKVEVASFSSLPKTVTDSRIKASDVCIEAVISDPSAQTGDWTITTAAGSLTISGSISGSTSATLFLTVPE